MITFIKLLMCLLLVQMSSGSTSKVAEDLQKLGETTLVPPNDTILPDYSTEVNKNVTKKIFVKSEEKPAVSNEDSLSPNTVNGVIPNIQRPSSINKKGYFPSIAEILRDKHLISIEFFNRLSTPGWMKPFQEKLQKIAEFFTHPNHPSLNFGSFHSFDPQQFIERLHEKSHQLLTGSQVSIYGTRPVPNYDFPFAYRNHKT